MTQEPTIRIGIHTDGEPEIRLQGDYEIEEQQYKTIYRPKNEGCRAIISNCTIGKSFHWQHNNEITLKGEIILNPGAKECKLINVISLEDYLSGVVSSEMNQNAPLEFLKAHTIISRSWIMGKLEHTHPDTSDGKKHQGGEVITWEDTADHAEFDICNDDHCQRYYGDTDVNDNVRRAIAMTKGVVLTDTLGCIIDSRFSKCCGGRTEMFSTSWQDLGFSYLQPIEDPYCDISKLNSEEKEKLQTTVFKRFDSLSSVYDWSETIDKKLVTKNLKERFDIEIGEVTDLTVLSRGSSGRIYRLKVKGKNGSVVIGKELAIRKLLSPTCLRSSAFDIIDEGEKFRLEGKGWGHGVGLCQTGAAVMALKGKSFSEILSFYYPTTHLLRLYE